MSAKTLTDWQIVMRSLRARPLSTWITIGMVATSVALLLVLFGMRTAARGAFDRGSGNIHLLVSADPGAFGIEVAPTSAGRNDHRVPTCCAACRRCCCWRLLQ